MRRSELAEVKVDDAAMWTLEERLWIDGVSVYNDLIDPACLIAFPGVGVMRLLLSSTVSLAHHAGLPCR